MASIRAIVERFADKLPIRFFYPYLSLKARRIPGQIRHREFTSATSGAQRYILYLPAGYEVGDVRYPVLYHLHGVRITERRAALDVIHLAVHMEQAVAAGVVTPMVIVAPMNPRMDMWADAHDGETKTATMFVQDLIPHIDSAFHTSPVRAHRAIGGFSMGGFGAAHLAMASPELFGALIEWDGAVHTWETLTANRPGIAEKVFASEEYFDRYSPIRLVGHASAAPRVMIVAGELKEYAGRFRDDLVAAHIAVSYVDTSCGHDLFCMLDATGQDAFAFLNTAGDGSSGVE